jgi:hypothetical protein
MFSVSGKERRGERIGSERNMQRKDTLATMRPDSAGLTEIYIACIFYFLYRKEEPNWATGCTTEDSWFSSGQVQQIFIFSRTSRRILGSMYWLLVAFSSGVKAGVA